MILLVLLIPLTLKLLVYLKNRKLLGFPRVLVEPQINYARLMAEDTKALITFGNKTKIIWQDWDLGLGKINRRIQQGDVLLVKGKWFNVYILVVIDTKPPEYDPNNKQSIKNNWYEFQSLFTGVIWNKMTYKDSRIF